jgi:hypothetical protein
MLPLGRMVMTELRRMCICARFTSASLIVQLTRLEGSGRWASGRISFRGQPNWYYPENQVRCDYYTLLDAP